MLGIKYTGYQTLTPEEHDFYEAVRAHYFLVIEDRVDDWNEVKDKDELEQKRQRYWKALSKVYEVERDDSERFETFPWPVRGKYHHAIEIYPHEANLSSLEVWMMRELCNVKSAKELKLDKLLKYIEEKRWREVSRKVGLAYDELPFYKKFAMCLKDIDCMLQRHNVQTDKRAAEAEARANTERELLEAMSRKIESPES